MNKYIRAYIVVPFGFFKILFTKVFHLKGFKAHVFCMISPWSEISLDYGGHLSIGKRLKMRDGAKIRVRKNAQCKIGEDFTIGTNCIVACRSKIIIGSKVLLSPNVQIYDHDHDFRAKRGIASKEYKTTQVTIGDNVWIGANSVILRGTKIGNNCVIGAGSVIKGEYGDNLVIIQNRKTEIKNF